MHMLLPFIGATSIKMEKRPGKKLLAWKITNNPEKLTELDKRNIIW